MTRNRVGIIKESIREELTRSPRYQGPDYIGQTAFVYAESDYDGRPVLDTVIYDKHGPRHGQPMGIHPDHLDIPDNQVEAWRTMFSEFVKKADCIELLRVGEAFYGADQFYDSPFMSGLVPYIDEHYGHRAVALGLSDKTYKRYLTLKEQREAEELLADKAEVAQSA